MPTFFRRHPLTCLLPLLLSTAPAWADGLVALDDEGLGEVVAQDGLTVDITSNTTSGITISEVNTTFDKGTTYEGIVRAEALSLRGVDGAGTVGGVAHAQVRLDAGAVAGTPRLNFELDLDRSRLSIGGLRIAADLTRNFGILALDASGQLRLQNDRGFFASTSTNAYLRGELTDATLFYTQITGQRPYLILNDMAAKWELNRGTVAITPAGIRQATKDNSINAGVGPGAGAVDATSLLNVTLDFDLLYKDPTQAGETTQFRITGTGFERPMLHFGWLGRLRNAEVVWKSGGFSQAASTVSPGATDGTSGAVGVAYNTAVKTKGLNFSSRWDFVNNAEGLALGDTAASKQFEFRWQLGEASGAGADKSRINFELGDWVRWNPSLYSHNFPLIALDALNGQQSPGGLCWGFRYNGPTSGACGGGGGSKQFVSIEPGHVGGFDTAAVNRAGTAQSLGLMVRDGNLMSYSRRVTFLERDTAGAIQPTLTRNFNWGLIYTFANVDANAFIYAGGNPADVTGGLVMDLSLMSQTFAPTDDTATTTINETLYQGFNWDNGSHLMIADTDVDKDGTTGENRDAMGIGLVSSSFLVLSNDMRIWVKPLTTANNYTQGGIDLMSPQTRFALNTTFGGGILPDAAGSFGTGPRVVKAGLIRLNFEGMLSARLSPAADVGSAFNPCGGTKTTYTCRNYLGYSWAMRFMDTNFGPNPGTAIDGFSDNTSGYAGWAGTAAQLGDYGSFLSIAEPNQPNVDIRLANITGDLTLEDGVIDIVGSTQDGDNTPKLRISHTMNLGAAAATRVNDAVTGRTASLTGGAAGKEFRIDRFSLGTANLGRIVIPSASIFASMTLRPQP